MARPSCRDRLRSLLLVQDVFEVDSTTLDWYNALADAGGSGKIVAGMNNAFLGLASFDSTTNGISTIDLNGKTGVTIGGSGSVLNLSGLTIADSSGSGLTATILAAPSYQTVTGTKGSDYFKVQSYGDTINGGGGNDTFEIDTTNAGWNNALSDVNGSGKIVVGVNNGFVGLASFDSTTNGISTIDLNGKTGVTIGGSGSVLNLSGLSIVDSSGSGQTATVLAGSSYQTVTGTKGSDYFKVQSYGDTINGGGGNDAFEIDTTTAGWYNALSDASGSGKIVAGMNNAFLGLASFDSTTNGISTIDLNGKTGVTIGGSGSVLNLSGLTIADSSGSGLTATILAAPSYQAVTGTKGSDYFKVQSYGDTINGGGGNDTFDIISGANTLYGSSGNARFLLDGQYGNDTIGDFSASRDTINLTADTGHYDWVNLISHATSSGSDLVLHTDTSGDTLTLKGVLEVGQTTSGYLAQNANAFKMA